MNLFRIFPIAFFLITVSSAAAQEYEINIIGPVASSRSAMTIGVDPEDMGRVSGQVLSGEGNAIAGASVVVYDGFNFYGVKSRKDGSYAIGSHFGTHIMDVALPGYRKHRSEVDMPKGGRTNMDIVLEPLPEGDSGVKPVGNTVACKGNALTLTVNSGNPAYKGKSLLDVLYDTPMLAIGDGKFAVADNETVDFYVNGKPFRAPFATAMKFFGSIGAEKVRSIRIMTWGPSISSWVSVSYAE